MVATVVPWICSILGIRRPQSSTGGAHSNASCAELLCRLAHVPSSMTKTVSAGCKPILRARCYMTRLVLSLQKSGLASMIRSMAAFRQSASGDDGTRPVAVIGWAHMWDESKQMLRQRVSVPGARQVKDQRAVNILVQTGMVHAVAVRQTSGLVDMVSRAESFVTPPLEVPGKSTAHLLGAFRVSSALPLFDTAAMQAIAQQVDCCVLAFWADAAATNRRLLKHLVALGETWAENIVLDVSQVCFLHQLHRVRTQMLEAHAIVSLMYCLSKLVKSGAVMGSVADEIERLMKERLVRVVGPPPPNAADRAKDILQILFNLDASHHLRFSKQGAAEPKTSQFRKDIDALLEFDVLSTSPDGKAVHHCWKADGSGPCCSSLEESQEKGTARFLNVFVAHGMPEGSLSRWTHVSILTTILACAYIWRDIFVLALCRGLGARADAEETVRGLSPATVGSGENDLQRQHVARLRKVQSWLSLASSRFHIGCLLLLTRSFDSLTYFLMGGEREGADRQHRQPGSAPRCDEPIAIAEVIARVARMLGEFAAMLTSWCHAGTSSELLLHAVGLTDDDLRSDENVRFARRHILGFSCGVFRRLAVRLRCFPFRLALLVFPEVPADRKAAIAEEFLQKSACCVGPFGKQLQRLYGSVDRLLSHAATATITVWLRSQYWSIYACERENGSLRRLIHSAGPARNFTLVARERVMESVRSVHVGRVQCDPMQGAGAQRPATPATRKEPIQDDPLHPEPAPVGPQSASSWCVPWALPPPPAAHQAGPLALSKRTPPDPVDAVAPAPKARRAGGSAFQEFQNPRMHQARQLAMPADLTPRGTLTEAARAKAMADIKQQWANLSQAGSG